MSVGMDIVEEFLAEEKMISEYLQLEKQMQEMEEKVQKHFRKDLDELLDQYKNGPNPDNEPPEEFYRLAVNIRNRCPSHVGKVFMQDAIRQAFRGTGLVKSGF